MTTTEGTTVDESGETRAIRRSTRPATVGTLRADLRALGIPPGAVVLVHASLTALGWVAGGAQAVVAALVDVFATQGTLMMPTHSAYLGDPARWQHPPVPASWWATIRHDTPAFDPVLTPTAWMGAIVECFRHVPGVRRSAHPMVSFAALGAQAEPLVGAHPLAYSLGEASPLGRLYDADGYVLLLGVGFERCTSLHLAEYRATYPGKDWFTQASPVLVDGQRRWVDYPELDGDSSDFAQLGTDYVATGAVRVGAVGAGTAHWMRQRPLVDFAVPWLAAHR